MGSEKLVFYNLAPRNERGWASLNGQKAWIALLELGIPFEERRIDRYAKDADFVQFYRRVWPDASAKPLVPAIVDTDGTALVESQIIVEYLDAKYGRQGHQLVPASAADAAKARLFLAVYEASTVFVRYLRADEESKVQQQRQAFLEGIKVVDAFLRTHGSSGGPFLLGQAYSLAEVLCASHVLVGSLLLKAVRGSDLVAEAKAAGYGRYAAWAQAVLDRPSTKQSSLHDPAKVSAESWGDWIKDMPQIGL